MVGQMEPDLALASDNHSTDATNVTKSIFFFFLHKNGLELLSLLVNEL